MLGPAGAGGVVARDGNKGRSFEALSEWEIDDTHAGLVRRRARASS